MLTSTQTTARDVFISLRLSRDRRLCRPIFEEGHAREGFTNLVYMV